MRENHAQVYCRNTHSLWAANAHLFHPTSQRLSSAGVVLMNALLNKTEALKMLWGSEASHGYDKLQRLVDEGVIRLYLDKWVPLADIKRLRGDD